MKLLSILVLLVSSSVVLGQEPFTFYIAIHDELSNELITETNVKIYSGDKLMVNRPNYNGEGIKLFCEDNFENLRIIASHEAFMKIDTLIQIDCTQFSVFKRSFRLKLYLKYDGLTSEEVDITATYQPEIIFSSEEFSVEDFQIDHEGNLFVLIYDKNMLKGSQIALYKDGELHHKNKVESGPHRLDLDYLGRVFLVGEESAWLVQFNKDIRLISVDKNEYDYHIAPIIDTCMNNLYFSNFNDWYPAMDFFEISFKEGDTVYRNLRHIEDHLMMELYLAEYKYVDVRTRLWAWDRERETGIDREIWVGLNSFTNTIYYEPIYANFFIKKDKYYITDHYDDFLFVGDVSSGDIVDSIPITYHTKLGKYKWKKSTQQDPITEKVYCRYDYVGQTKLVELDLETGKINYPFELFYKYVEKVRILNDEVYYIYRPFETAQKKYLYREKISDMVKLN